MGMRGGFGPHWLGITWSLAVEEQFYLFVPLLVYLLPRRVLLAVFLCAILAAPILRCASGGFHAFVNTPWRADSLLSGAALAVLVRWHPFMSAVQRHGRLLRPLFVTLLAGAAVMTLRPLQFAAFSHFWLAGLYTIFILIAFARTEPHMESLLRSPVLVWFGRLSYGIYMFHEAVSGMLHGALRHGVPQIRTLSDIGSAPEIRTPFDAGITILALFVTLLLAMFSYHFFESPILRFGHRFQYSPKPRVDSSLQVVSNDEGTERGSVNGAIQKGSVNNS
jgi:peptidoglycan/LPS O-acetylase OafA/YrhL